MHEPIYRFFLPSELKIRANADGVVEQSMQCAMLRSDTVDMGTTGQAKAVSGFRGARPLGVLFWQERTSTNVPVGHDIQVARGWQGSKRLHLCGQPRRPHLL